ncbi:MAG: ABC transporter ATP-binding protein [candidate division WS1 bacterium]|nr:ABC transporter ATP-binding protein [candidate division WS1 bacterium]
MIQMRSIVKRYGEGDTAVEALRALDLAIEEGEFVAIVGPSGCGKSTLMNIAGCLDQPTSGEYLLDGEDVSALEDEELSRVRNAKIGFVFQSFILLPRTTALENVEMPTMYAHHAVDDGHERAKKLLEDVGLGQRLHHLPTELSGGQQQRVAIARSLIADPAIILADEPTGALDKRSGLEVTAIFQRLHEQGRTIVMVTHDLELAAHAHRIVTLEDGAIASDEPVEEPRDAEAELAELAETAEEVASA